MDEKKVISSTLRYGVIISSILIVSGMLIFIVLHSNSSVNIYAYNTSNIDIFNLNNPLNISLYGLIVLISLPVLIVGEQIVIYSTERDKIYILISLVVLSLMIFAIIIMPRLLH